MNPGATQFTWIESFPELLRERAGEGDDRALARDVVEEERNSAEGRPRGDVHDLSAALLAHDGNDGAARQEHARDVDLHHPVPLLERDLGEGTHLERRVEARVVHEDVDPPVPGESLLDHPSHVRLGRDVGADATLRRFEVGDRDHGSLRLEPVGDRSADALRAAGDDRDLPVELTHQPSGENEVGTRILFCCVCMSGCTLRRNSCQRSSAWSRPRFSSRSAERVVPPERRVGRERPDVGRERADEPAEDLVLEWDSLGLVEPNELGQLAGVDVVVALLDDHRGSPMPPSAQYLSSSHSSIP